MTITNPTSVGGAVNYSAALTQNQSLLLQPAGTEEHSVFHIVWSAPTSGAVQLRRVTPDGEILFGTSSAAGQNPTTGHTLYKCTNTNYLKVTNTGTATVYVSGDGVRTK